MSLLSIFILGMSLGVSAPGADCGTFEKSIDESLKSVAMAEAGTLGDNSAPRQTNTELKVANELHLISLNVELMKAAGCPLPEKPLSKSKFFFPALECHTAIMRQTLNRGGGSEVPSECDRSKWQPPGAQKENPSPAAAETAAGVEASPSATAPPPASATITLAEFQEVSTGMTYEQVVALVGAEGSGPTSVPEGASMTDVYIWTNGSGAANMRVGFRDGKVVWKDQTWLD